MEYGFVIGGMLLAFVIASLYQHFKMRQHAQVILERSHLLEIGAELKKIQEYLKLEYSASSPPVLNTSKGLIMTYMRSESPKISLFLHNFSILNSKIPWTERTQSQLIAYICNVIGTKLPDTVQISDKGILHFSFIFDDIDEHQSFFTQTIEIPEFPRAFLQPSEPITVEKITLPDHEEEYTLESEELSLS
jgi:hypothetical protein